MVQMKALGLWVSASRYLRLRTSDIGLRHIAPYLRPRSCWLNALADTRLLAHA